MRSISHIAKYGAASIRKAKQRHPRVRRRQSHGHLAFTVQGRNSRYIVRLAIESGKAVAECIHADSGVPCEGFRHRGHCYHLGSVLLAI